MSIIYLLLAFLAAVCIGGVCYNFYRADELDEWRDELSKYSVSLDERANRLALWEQQLADYSMDAADEGQTFSVKYCLSETDEMKYTTEDSAFRHARRQMAATLANDIVHAFPVKVSDDGKTFTYEFKIKQ